MCWYLSSTVERRMQRRGVGTRRGQGPSQDAREPQPRAYFRPSVSGRHALLAAFRPARRFNAPGGDPLAPSRHRSAHTNRNNKNHHSLVGASRARMDHGAAVVERRRVRGRRRRVVGPLVSVARGPKRDARSRTADRGCAVFSTVSPTLVPHPPHLPVRALLTGEGGS